VRTRLFDASSIMLLAKRSPESASEVIEGELVLDLTRYEVGNAIWRLHRLIERDGAPAAVEAAAMAHDLMALTEETGVDGEEGMRATMRAAYETGLSFYDSAYLSTAASMGLVLVTEDAQLRRRAEERGLSCASAAGLFPGSDSGPRQPGGAG
jgi:predicted nucleic acid-binding protein